LLSFRSPRDRPHLRSFPTLRSSDLPRELRISYVTESPAWKPSYRLKLSKQGPARLEAWAVVDNVSGEDWKRVAVGVGSTSALSRSEEHTSELLVISYAGLCLKKKST